MLKVMMTTDMLQNLSPLVAKRTLERAYSKRLRCPVAFKFVIDKIAIIEMPQKEERIEGHFFYSNGRYLVFYHIKLAHLKNTGGSKAKITPVMIEKQIQSLHSKLSPDDLEIVFDYTITNWEDEELGGDSNFYSEYRIFLMSPKENEVPLDINVNLGKLALDVQITKRGKRCRAFIDGKIEHGVLDLRRTAK